MYGHWSDPWEQLIRKETLTDLVAGTMGFFADSVKTGGDLGAEIVLFPPIISSSAPWAKFNVTSTTFRGSLLVVLTLHYVTPHTQSRQNNLKLFYRGISNLL